MAVTQIHGELQIKDNTILLSKLISPFISATTGDWDITAGNLDATITGIPDPVNPYDVVNKHYVDQLLGSRIWKSPAITVMSPTNIDINNPPSSVDGVTLQNGDRIALFNQTNGTEDGVYIYNGTGNALVRAPEWAEGEDAASWTFIVEKGDTYADGEFTITNDTGSAIIGTDDLNIIQTGGTGTYNFQNALTKTGSIIEWGGTLLHNTTVDGASLYNIQFNNLTSYQVITSSEEITLNGGLTVKHSGSGNTDGVLYITDNDTNLYFENTSSGTKAQVQLSSSGITLTDQLSSKGAVYADNYFGNGYADDRWISDWGAIKSRANTITVRVAAPGNIDITNAPASIDGVTLSNGDLVALFSQSTSTEDGIYIYNGSGNTMTRASYFPSGYDIKGFLVTVSEGNTYGDSVLLITNNTSAVLGTDDITFIVAGGATAVNADNGLHMDGNTVKLGGTLVENTTIQLSDYLLKINKSSSLTTPSGIQINLSGTGTAGSTGYQIFTNSFGGRTSAGSGNWYSSIVDAGNNIIKIGYGTSGNTSILDFTTNKGLEITSSTFSIIDSTDNKGVVYADDYHINWTDRSIVDKQYIDVGRRAITVRAMATSNIDLSNSPDSIDGVSLQVGDLVALFDQTTSTEDGIYEVTAVDNVAHTSTLVRAKYFESGVSILGYSIVVREGTERGNTLYIITNDTSATLGTDNITYIAVGGANSAYSFQNALTKTGSIIEWGGDLNHDTTINGISSIRYKVSFLNIGEFKFSTDSNGDNGLLTLTDSNFKLRTASTFVEIATNISSYDIFMGLDDSFSGTDLAGVGVGGSKIYIVDTLNTAGAAYAADYHTNGISTHGDRWIPDWGAVKSLVNDAVSRTYNEIHDISSDTTSITLSGATAGDGKTIKNVAVYVNGERQAEGSTNDYTITDADAGTITFTYTLPAGSRVLVDYTYS